MPVISQSDIDEDIRLPFLDQYRQKLRLELLNPGLNSEQIQRIREKLASAGKQKEYRKDSPPLPGAIEAPSD